MANEWAEDQQDAYEDLKEDGALFTFVRKSGSKPDPITGEIADDFTTSFQTYGIMTQLSSGTDIRGQVRGFVEMGEELLLVSAKGYEHPKIEDAVEIDGIMYKVKDISTLRPGVVPILHYLSIKRG